MFRQVVASNSLAGVVSTTACAKRNYWLYASYNASRNMDRRMKPQQRYGAPQAGIQAMLKEKRLLGSVEGTSPAAESEETAPVGGDNGDEVKWDKTSSADIVALTAASNADSELSTTANSSELVKGRDIRPLAKNPFVPLAECAKMELSGDYCYEGGLYQDAVERYGVVAKAFKAAYPENHNMQAGIALKLARTFRCLAARASESRGDHSTEVLHQAAEYNVTRALKIFNSLTNPCVELVAESFIELGRLRALQDKPDAGALFEDSLRLLNDFHDVGVSSRLLKQYHFSISHNHFNLEQKFAWFSPYDFDRVFALVDCALEEAEAVYRKQGDQEGVVRVLTAKTQLVDRKFFNMRNDAGKIGRNRAQWRDRSRNLAATPSATDLLTYTPTVHQIYRDFSLENTAPLDFDTSSLPGDRVQQGGNRKVVDDGDPMRFKLQEQKEEARMKSIKPLYDEAELLRW